MGKCQGDCGIPQPSLQSEDMPQKPLDVSTPLFYPRAEEQQASLPGEQPRDANAARIHKSVRVCSHMVHHKQPYGKRRAVFLLQFPGTLRMGAPSGTRTACCGGDRRLRREQGTGAGAAVAENKPRQGAPFDAVTASRDPAFSVPRGKNAPVGRF